MGKKWRVTVECAHSSLGRKWGEQHYNIRILTHLGEKKKQEVTKRENKRGTV